jgi:hypothetical protein
MNCTIALRSLFPAVRARRALPLLVLLAALAAACARAEAVPPTPTLRAFAPPGAQPSPQVQDAPCPPLSMRHAAAHTVEATLDYTARTLDIAQTVVFSNRTNTVLGDLAFTVEANRYPGQFADLTVQADGAPAAFTLEGRSLRVVLAAPLNPGCDARVVLAYRLSIPRVGQGGIPATGGYFAYTDRQLNLGHWLATVAHWREGGWVLHPVAAVGEAVVSEPADWAVDLTVVNAPEGLTVAAPGTLTQTGDRFRIELTGARELAVSMSDRFIVREAAAPDGTQIALYTFTDTVVQTSTGTLADGAAQALDDAARSIGLYSDLFGPYGRERFVVVEGDFTDGMEFTGIVFVSDDWFRTFPGSPAGYLTLITVHEAAHQWWYARVGSDQALMPWLDEALATYSEYIFLEEFYPELKSWWWQFRVESFVPDPYTGQAVNSTVFTFEAPRAYINAVYLRGAQMLDALRRDLGTEAFFAWLRRYAELGADRIVTEADFWGLLTPEQTAATAATRALFLYQPGAPG